MNKSTKTIIQFALVFGIILSNTSSSENLCRERQRGHLLGNFTLGFLFSFHGYNDTTKECSGDITSNVENIQLLEAAYMTLMRTREKQPPSLGLESWDTCSSSHLAVKTTLEYLGNPSMYHLQGDICTTTKPGILASLNTDGQAEAVARLMDEARVPLISFAASQPSLTKDNKYPYFLRTVPNDEVEAVALVMLLGRLNWSYVITINLDSVEDAAALNAFRQAASQAGICISSSHEFLSDSSNEEMDDIINDVASNAANVVVAFTSSSGVKKLIPALNRAGATALTFQVVLNHRAFLGIDESQLLQGLLGFRIPEPTTVDAFDDYFKHLTPQTVNPFNNPWFAEYWQRKYNCNLGEIAVYPTNCSTLQEEIHSNTYKRNPYVSSVIDAVDAYVEGVQAYVHDSNKQLLSHIKQVNLTRNDGHHFAFHSSGDIYYSSLELINYKMDHDTNLRLTSVGHYKEGQLILEVNDLELWSNGRPIPVQSVCSFPCLDPACQAILNVPDNDTVIYVPGDIILGGLFSVHNWNESESACGSLDESGVKRLEAMFYAMDKINKDTSILPGITLGMDGFDTCANPNRAGHQALQMISEVQFELSGSGHRPNSDRLLEHLYGIIGPNGDEESELVNGVLNVYGIPMISYAATSVYLSNFAYYKNFARTVFPDTFVGFVFMEAVLHRGWEYVQAIASDTASGGQLLSFLRNIGPQRGVCVTTSQTIPSVHNEDKMDDIFHTLTTRPTAKVVLIAATNKDMRAILKEFRLRNLFGEYYLILSTEWNDPPLQLEFADISPGITFVSERKRSYHDFKTYFSSLTPFTNLRNPWFAEYWTNTFQCNLQGVSSVYLQNCTGTESLTGDNATDGRIAETVDAVYAMAHAITVLHGRYCPGQSDICPEMTKASGDELFQVIASRENSFESVNDGYKIEISSNGEVRPEYEIYNVQQMANGTLLNVKVGVYRNYVYVSESQIIVYSKHEESYDEIIDAVSTCRGPCDDCKHIETMKVAEVSGGDVWIGGLFELHEPASELQCRPQLIPSNIQLIEAFMFAIEQVNMNADILPELKLGAIAFDTCGSADRAQREVLNFVSGTVDYRSGYATVKPVVVGIIGGQTSDTSVTVAKTLTPLGVNQISYAATTTELSDPVKFPYFLRTVPSDDKQATAIVDLLLIMNWNYVSIVYSNNSYGTDLWKGVTKRLSKNLICVAMSLTVSFHEIDHGKVVEQLLMNPQAKLVLLLTSVEDTRLLLESAESKSVTDLQWIGTETWGSRGYIIDMAKRTTQGALILSFHPALMMSPSFKEYFTNLQPYSNRRNPWWITFWEDTFQCNMYRSSRYNVSCSWNLDLAASYMQETEVSNILDAVHLFATGLHNAMMKECPGVTRFICAELATHPEILHRHIQEANYTRTDGSNYQLNEHGEGVPNFDLFNLQASVTEATTTYVKVGSWISGTWNLSSSLIVFQNNMTVSSVASHCQGRCTECHDQRNVFAHIPGIVQILALFDIHSPGDHIIECSKIRERGILNLEAMLFAIDMINADTTLLNGISLGASAFDTCSRGTRGIRDLSSFLSGAIDIENNPQGWSLVGGVIAGETDQVTTTTALLTQQFKYTQISYGFSTETDNQPSNLLKMGPTIDNQISAIIHLLQHFQWKYVSIISSLSDYRLQQSTTFIDAALDMGICIGTQEQIHKMNNIATVLQNIYETTAAHIVILFTDDKDTVELMQEVEMRSDTRHLTWIISYNEHLEEQISNNNAILGALLINVQTEVPLLKEYFASLTTSINKRDPWFPEFIGQKYNCNINGIGDYKTECSGLEHASITVHSSMVANVVNSVYAIAHGLQDLISLYCGSNSQGLCTNFVGLKAETVQQSIEEVSFTGLDGSKIHFKHGMFAQPFTIWNYKDMVGSNKFVKVGSWLSGNLSIQTNRVSMYSLQGQLQSTPLLSQCQPTDPCSSHCYDSFTTVSPPLHTNSPQSISNFSSVWFVILIIIAILGILSTLAVIVIFVFCWKYKVTQEMSPFLCLMLLLGILFMYLLIPIYAAPPSVFICTLQRLWPGVAFALCHVAIFLMIMRIYRMAKHDYVISGSLPTCIHTSSQIVFYFSLLAVEIVILVEWFILQPPEVIASKIIMNTLNGDTVLAICGYTGSALTLSLTYVYVLVVLSLMTAIAAWGKKDVIHPMEIKTLLLTIIGSMIVLIVWILIELLDDRNIYQPGLAIIATIKATFILLLFFPRVKVLISRCDMMAADYGDGALGTLSAEDINGDDASACEVNLKGLSASYTKQTSLES